MLNSPDRQEPQYTQDLQPNHVDTISPDQAHDIDFSIVSSELPQVPEGQETEPSKKYTTEIVGPDRHATVGSAKKRGEANRVQTQKRPDLMIIVDEASDQLGAISTEGAIRQAQEQNRVLFASDFVRGTTQDLINTDVVLLVRTYAELRKGRLNRAHTPVGNPGSRIVASKARP